MNCHQESEKENKAFNKLEPYIYGMILFISAKRLKWRMRPVIFTSKTKPNPSNPMPSQIL
jgi:hypothetical protein